MNQFFGVHWYSLYTFENEIFDMGDFFYFWQITWMAKTLIVSVLFQQLKYFIRESMKLWSNERLFSVDPQVIAVEVTITASTVTRASITTTTVITISRLRRSASHWKENLSSNLGKTPYGLVDLEIWYILVCFCCIWNFNYLP